MLMSNSSALGIVGSTLDLVIVVVEANDIDASEAGHLSCGAADTAADIKNLHVFSETHSVSKVVLVASNGLVEVLALVESAEMERLAPSVLVEISGKVVVVSRQGGVGSRALLQNRLA
jgi:hypothetical protein